MGWLARISAWCLSVFFRASVSLSRSSFRPLIFELFIHLFLGVVESGRGWGRMALSSPPVQSVSAAGAVVREPAKERAEEAVVAEPVKHLSGRVGGVKVGE